MDVYPSDQPKPWEGLTYSERLERTTYPVTVWRSPSVQSRMDTLEQHRLPTEVDRQLGEIAAAQAAVTDD